ncbi:Lysosomal beta glucosidase [Smittium culicis]|uniref:beta-glucosidase n=1 Tax=Smittium culicis TaxID=133412 RepID=A0A1R1XSK9_9FUNG|nr:Lysosomal beta glucosidase [Smittium culicis]
MKYSRLFYFLTTASVAIVNSQLLNSGYSAQQPVIDVIGVKKQNGVVCLPDFFPLKDYDPMRPASVPTYSLPKYDEENFTGPNAELDSDVLALLNSLTLEEKAGQMNQVHIDMFIGCDGLINITAAEIIFEEWKVGSVIELALDQIRRWNINSPQRFANFTNTIQSIAISRGSRIPVIWGIDTIRGANLIKGATMFPAPINMAATFDPTHAYNMGRIGAKDTRSAGLHWAFSPLADISRHKMFSRNFENFGEDTYLSGEMVYHNVKGLQGDYKNDRTKVAACVKHFIGYSSPKNGQDRDNVEVPWNILLEYLIPPFKRAVDAGVATFMENYGQVNHQSTILSKKLLNELLRDQLGFNGTLVTDFAEVNNQWNWYNTAFDAEDSTKISLLNGSLDMAMTASDNLYANSTINLVKAGLVDIKRVDQSVGRILQLKKDLGLFQNPYADPSLIDTVGSNQDVVLSRNAARESLILLKNEKRVLPLATTDKVLFVGAAFDSINDITGAWSVHWQGATEYEGDNIYDIYGETIRAGVKNVTGSEPNYIIGYNITGNRSVGYDDVVKAARMADKVVFLLGEKPSTEGIGNIKTLRMAKDQYNLVRSVSQQTETSIVLLLAQNRPFSLEELVTDASAIMNIGLPGPYSGIPIAEVLYGKASPSGRQPYSYPKLDYQAPVTYYTPQWNEYDPEFAFGQGMGYNNITYSEVTVSSTDLSPGKPIKVSVTATNNGIWEQNEPVLMFTTQLVRRSYVSEHYRLRAFDKHVIAPGTSKTFTFTLTAEEMSFIDLDMNRALAEGPVNITMNAFNENAKIASIYLHEK